MYFVYVLFSEKLNKRYVGSTSDVQQRLLEHNSGHSKFTKGVFLGKLFTSKSTRQYPRQGKENFS